MNKIIVASVIGLGLIASTLVATDAQGQRRGGVAVFHGPAGGTAVFRGGSAFHPYYGGGWHGGHCCWNGYAWVAPAIIGGAILGGALAAPYLYAPPPPVYYAAPPAYYPPPAPAYNPYLGSPAWLPVLILGGTAVSSASAPSRRGQRAARVFEQQSGNRRTVFSVIQPARSGGPRPRCRHGGKPR